MSEIERVKYTPVSVRETLIMMKDISELMIDLAYSAALFNNRELAEEVTELEEKMDSLVYVLNMNLMLAARDKADAETSPGSQRWALSPTAYPMQPPTSRASSSTI